MHTKRELKSCGLIYLKSKGCIILFGGVVKWSEHSEDVYQFSIVDKQFEWTELNVKIPITLGHMGIVKTLSERYVSLLCGRNVGREIYIYDV